MASIAGSHRRPRPSSVAGKSSLLLSAYRCRIPSGVDSKFRLTSYSYCLFPPSEATFSFINCDQQADARHKVSPVNCQSRTVKTIAALRSTSDTDVEMGPPTVASLWCGQRPRAALSHSKKPQPAKNGVVGNVGFIRKIGMGVGWLFVNAPTRLCSLFKQTDRVLS